MRRRPNIGFDRVNGKTVIFTGGVNEGVTNLELRPGDLFTCTNYEEIDGAFHGYRSVQGTERLDGQPSPSSIPIQFLPDSGNDSHTVFLLESEDDEDGYDKSARSYGVSTGNVVFDTTRSRVGEGSWKFQDGSDTILVDQSASPIDFSQENWTIELIFNRQTTSSYCTLFEKSGTVRIRLANDEIQCQISTNGGSFYNWSQGFDITSIGTWDEMKFVKKDSEMICLLNGKEMASFDIGSEVVHTGTNDIQMGHSVSTDAVWVDACRVSNTTRAVTDYAYIDDLLFSDPTYFVENADDRDREIARELIEPVPGEGPVTGIHIYKGYTYAFRQTAAPQLASGFFKETPSGWEEQTNYTYEINVIDSFIEDDTEVPVYGEAFTTAGGATGFVVDYVLHEGDPTAGEAYGILQLELTSGTFTNGEIITITSTGATAVFDGTPAIPGFGIGTNIDFAIGRFAYFPPSNPASETMYFLGNNNRIFAWDGNQIYNIQGPLGVTEQPTDIAIFGDRLFVAYEDGSLFYSAVGDPANWSGFWGAGEIKMGDTIQGLVEAPGSVLVIMMRNTTKLLTTVGEVGVYNFKVDEYSQNTGGYRNTAVQLLGDVYYCDDRGPTSLKATDAFGDFANTSIKKKANLTYQGSKLDIVGAYIQRAKTQYRILSSSTGSGSTKCISITFGDNKGVKGTTIAIYPHEFTCFDESEDPDGNVKIVAGAADGFVYRMDSGVSFDGGPIITRMSSAYYHYATPRNWKRFHRVLFEISAQNKTKFYFKPSFNYSSSDMLVAREQSTITSGQGGIWDSSLWNHFIWGGSVVSNPMIYLRGAGYNMSMSIRTNSKYYEPHTIHNMIVDYANGSRVM